MSGEAPAGISMREATPEDRVDVARVLDGALLEVEDPESRLADGQVLVATAGEMATAGGTATAGDGATAGGTATEGETVVGALVFAPEGPSDRSPPSAWPEATHVRAIAVRRKRRRRGIGTALIRAALERRSPIVADFEADLRPFYEALGADCEDGSDDRHWALLEASEVET